MEWKKILVRYRAFIGKMMMFFLLFGLMVTMLDVVMSRDIDWKQAQLIQIKNAQLRPDEAGKHLLLSDGKGREASFPCLSEDVLCQAATAYHAGHNGTPMSADIEYLSLKDYGALMLGADYLDNNTHERVSLRYSKEVVDRQAAQIEEAETRWSRILMPLRQFSLTFFMVLLAAWLYAGHSAKRTSAL